MKKQIKLKKEDILFIVALKEETGNLFKDLDLIYCGVGKVNATYYLTSELTKRKLQNKLPKYIINFGSCGSKKFKKGELIASNKFIQRDMDATIFNYKLGETPSEKNIPKIIEHNKIINDLKYGICGSGDNFATKESEIKEIDLFDMEAYALAKVCYFENIDFISIKYVTDGLNEEGGKDWDKKIIDAPNSFKNYIYGNLLKNDDDKKISKGKNKRREKMKQKRNSKKKITKK